MIEDAVPILVLIGAFFRPVVTTAEASALSVPAATGLQLMVVITTLGVDEHKMKPQNAAALVAAGMLSVLIYPIVGLRRLAGSRRSQMPQHSPRTRSGEPVPGPGRDGRLQPPMQA